MITSYRVVLSLGIYSFDSADLLLVIAILNCDKTAVCATFDVVLDFPRVLGRMSSSDYVRWLVGAEGWRDLDCGFEGRGFAVRD